MPEETPFFLASESVLDALQTLAQAEDLVIYCGAGVTIDRTGLSWSGLLQAVLSDGKQHNRKHQERRVAAIEYLMSEIADEEQAASILVRYFAEEHGKTVREFLVGALQRALYEDNGWSEGRLLNNLADLMTVAALRMRSVTIFTTNYDTYIEDEYLDVHTNLAHRGGSTLPGLIREIYSRDDQGWVESVVCDPVNAAVSVRLIYLHGRIPRPATQALAFTDIVFDEHSYADAHARTVQKLRQHLDPTEIAEPGQRAFLTVGASLTDAPLVESLALARSDEAQRQRFALLRTAITLDPDLPLAKFSRKAETGIGKDVKETLRQEDVEEALLLRGRHLGVTLLQSMSHSQTAQFIEELGLSINLQHGSAPRRSYRDDELAYAKRLETWAGEWASEARTSQEAHEILREALKGPVSRRLGGKSSQNEKLRLEIWIRMNPRTDDRTFTLFASSAGPLLDPHVRRSEWIRNDSKNASVRTFLEGRPLLQSIEDLGLKSPEASRWKTYFSVPISLIVGDGSSSTEFSASIPVAVVTLAGLEDSELATRFHRMSLENIKGLREELVGTGSSILR